MSVMLTIAVGVVFVMMICLPIGSSLHKNWEVEDEEQMKYLRSIKNKGVNR